MSRVYSAISTYENSKNIGTDLFFMTTGSAVVTAILSIRMAVEIDPAGDSVSALLPLLIVRRGTAGAGGSTITAKKMELGSNGTAAATLVERRSTAGTTEAIYTEDIFYNQASFLHQPIPSERIVLGPSVHFAVRLPTIQQNSPYFCTIVWSETG